MSSNDERQTNLPIERPKYSLLSRIRAIFSKMGQESEIDRIAEQISRVKNEDSKTVEASDKKMPVYEFFKDRELHKSRYTVSRGNCKAEYTDVEGNKKSFVIVGGSGRDAHIFSQDGAPIVIPHKLKYSIGSDEYHPTQVDVAQEYMDLIEYASFISQGSGDSAFINEMGRLIEEVSEDSHMPQAHDAEKVGKQLDKALRKNPIYQHMEKSYRRAFEEYIETAKDFYKEHEEKEDANNRRNEFLDGLKIEESSENKQAEERREDNETSKEKRDEAVNDMEEER